MNKKNHISAAQITFAGVALLIAITIPSPASAAESATTEVGWFRRTFCALTWGEIATAVESPKDISRRVKTQVTYTEDMFDEMAAAEDTWTNAKGDCEDFAACVVALCEMKGFEAWIHVFYKEGSAEAHAVAMGRYKGKLWISSNGWYQSVKSIADAEREMARDLGWDKQLVASATWKEIMTNEQFNGRKMFVAAN